MENINYPVTKESWDIFLLRYVYSLKASMEAEVPIPMPKWIKWMGILSVVLWITLPILIFVVIYVDLPVIDLREAI
jgi:uncharacterized membrane protein YhdT